MSKDDMFRYQRDERLWIILVNAWKCIIFFTITCQLHTETASDAPIFLSLCQMAGWYCCHRLLWCSIEWKGTVMCFLYITIACISINVPDVQEYTIKVHILYQYLYYINIWRIFFTLIARDTNRFLVHRRPLDVLLLTWEATAKST